MSEMGTYSTLIMVNTAATKAKRSAKDRKTTTAIQAQKLISAGFAKVP